MLSDCPQCGAPLPRDGDRLYTDWCEHCGWKTPERAATDNLNRAIFGHRNHAENLARHLYEAQVLYDQSCGYNIADPDTQKWSAQPDKIKQAWRTKAQAVLISREEPMRHTLITVRQRKREGIIRGG